nr:TolC family protein [FCB group bacterium]
MKSALELALKNNPDIVRSGYDFQSAMAGYNSVRTDMYPSVSLEMQTPDYSERLSEQYLYGSGGSLTRVWVPSGDFRYQSSILMAQKLPTGGSVNLMSILYKRDYYTGSGEDREDKTEYSSYLRLSVEQPIFQSNLLKYNLRKSRLDLETSKLNRQIILRELDFFIAVGYYNLIRSERRLKLEADDHERWLNSVAVAQDKFKAGLIPEVEVFKLQVESARRQGSLASAVSSYQRTADDLKMILGLSLTDSISVITDIEKLGIEEGSIEDALKFRQELMIAGIGLQKDEMDLIQSKREAGLNASVQAYYDFTSKEQAVMDLPGSPESDRGVSVNLAIPILDWKQSRYSIESKEAALKKSRYDYEQSRRNFISTVRQAERDLQSVDIQLKSAKLAEELALKSYNITR